MPESEFNHLLHAARILIVDDETTICMLMRKAFEKEGYSFIDTASTGKEAMRKIMESVDEHEPYDLVILDLLLPGETSGQDIYNTVSSTIDIPIVVISGLDAKEEQVCALKSLAVEEYFVKPVDTEIFMLKVERILARRVFSRQIEVIGHRSQKLFFNVIQVMAKVLEAKDPYTRFHSQNVAKYARQIAKRMGYSANDLELIRIAGVLHDFGKIGIKETVLNKNGALTEEEYIAVKRHPLIASAILEPIDEFKIIISDIRHHHERFDGRGYPDGLSGTDIPLGSRILCVADSYDAMTSFRPYHEPKTEASAISELRRCAGAQFDPEVVEHFIAIIAENSDRRERIARLREQIG